MKRSKRGKLDQGILIEIFGNDQDIQEAFSASMERVQKKLLLRNLPPLPTEIYFKVQHP